MSSKFLSLSGFKSSLARFEQADGLPAYAPIGFLAVICAAFFLPALLTPNVLIWPHSGLGSDISYRHWPDLQIYAHDWAAGRIVLWDSLTALGRPLAGDPTVLFLYPFVIVFAWLPPALAINVLDAVHVFLACVFMFMFLRLGFKTSQPASLIGALTYAFAPKFISHLACGHVGVVWGLAWSPLVLLGLKLAMDGKLLGGALGGAALAIQLPTHLQMPYYTAVIASAFWAWHLAEPIKQVVSGQREAWKRIRWLLTAYGVWLISFMLLAAFVLFPLLELLPYNSRTSFGLEDANYYSLPPFMLLSLVVPTNFQFPEWTMFIGLLPPLLSALGGRGQRRWVWLFFILLTAFALVYSLGASTPLFVAAQTIIPGFNMLRVPPRLWFFGGLALAITAAFGLDRLSDPDLLSKLLKHKKYLILLAAVYMGGGLVGWVGYWLIYHRWHEPMFLRLVTALITITLGAAWLKGRITGRMLQWVLIPVLIFDLLPIDAAQIDLADPQSVFLKSTAALDYVSAKPGIFRIYSVSGDLPYAIAAERGVETLESSLAFQIGHSVRIIRAATGCAEDAHATAIPICIVYKKNWPRPNLERLGELNVRYILSPTSYSDPNLKLVLDSRPLVYENMLWQPRAKLTTEGIATIVNRSPGSYTISVAPSRAGQLIVSETWLPGWQAIVDGQMRAVTPVDEALIGVTVEPGVQTVQLQYNPIGWQLGWPVTLISLAALMFWCSAEFLMSRRRRSQAARFRPC